MNTYRTRLQFILITSLVIMGAALIIFGKADLERNYKSNDDYAVSDITIQYDCNTDNDGNTCTLGSEPVCQNGNTGYICNCVPVSDPNGCGAWSCNNQDPMCGGTTQPPTDPTQPPSDPTQPPSDPTQPPSDPTSPTRCSGVSPTHPLCYNAVPGTQPPGASCTCDFVQSPHCGCIDNGNSQPPSNPPSSGTKVTAPKQGSGSKCAPSGGICDGQNDGTTFSQWGCRCKQQSNNSCICVGLATRGIGESCIGPSSCKDYNSTDEKKKTTCKNVGGSYTCQYVNSGTRTNSTQTTKSTNNKGGTIDPVSQEPQQPARGEICGNGYYCPLVAPYCIKGDGAQFCSKQVTEGNDPNSGNKSQKGLGQRYYTEPEDPVEPPPFAREYAGNGGDDPLVGCYGYTWVPDNGIYGRVYQSNLDRYEVSSFAQYLKVVNRTQKLRGDQNFYVEVDCDDPYGNHGSSNSSATTSSNSTESVPPPPSGSSTGRGDQ
jgi:hypothetical protein